MTKTASACVRTSISVVSFWEREDESTRVASIFNANTKKAFRSAHDYVIAFPPILLAHVFISKREFINFWLASPCATRQKTPDGWSTFVLLSFWFSVAVSRTQNFRLIEFKINLWLTTILSVHPNWNYCRGCSFFQLTANRLFSRNEYVCDFHLRKMDSSALDSRKLIVD